MNILTDAEKTFDKIQRAFMTKMLSDLEIGRTPSTQQSHLQTLQPA